MVLVFPGLPETLARLFLPVSKLSRDDLPTLERPAKAISAILSWGYWEALTATASILASLIIILQTLAFRQSIFQCFFSFFKKDEIQLFSHSLRNVVYICLVIGRQKNSLYTCSVSRKNLFFYSSYRQYFAAESYLAQMCIRDSL